MEELLVLFNREDGEYPGDGWGLQVGAGLDDGLPHAPVPGRGVPRVEEELGLGVNLGDLLVEQRHWLPYTRRVAPV